MEVVITRTKEDELCHYGVPGMKWGVRRDIRLLANSRRNKAVREAKEKYKAGRITKATRDSRINKANVAKKQDIDLMTKKVANAQTAEKQIKASADISKMVMKEVPNYKIKRGAATVNNILSNGRIKGLGIASIVGVATANPALAVAGAAGMAAEIGAKYLTEAGLDKLS